MTIVHRRVFYGKIGNGHAIIKHLQEGNDLMRKLGADFDARVLSDYQTGRTDRIVVEWEADQLTEFEAMMNRFMEDPEFQPQFEPWVNRLNELIHYAEAENWTIH